MIEDMVPIFILGVIGYFILELVKVVSENRLRNRLIDKGLVDEKSKLLLESRSPPQPEGSLKWGIVLIGWAWRSCSRLGSTAGCQLPSAKRSRPARCFSWPAWA